MSKSAPEMALTDLIMSWFHRWGLVSTPGLCGVCTFHDAEAVAEEFKADILKLLAENASLRTQLSEKGE